MNKNKNCRWAQEIWEAEIPSLVCCLARQLVSWLYLLKLVIVNCPNKFPVFLLGQNFVCLNYKMECFAGAVGGALITLFWLFTKTVLSTALQHAYNCNTCLPTCTPAACMTGEGIAHTLHYKHLVKHAIRQTPGQAEMWHFTFKYIHFL